MWLIAMEARTQFLKFPGFSGTVRSNSKQKSGVTTRDGRNGDLRQYDINKLINILKKI